jgi:hypothetical protein
MKEHSVWKLWKRGTGPGAAAAAEGAPKLGGDESLELRMVMVTSRSLPSCHVWFHIARVLSL